MLCKKVTVTNERNYSYDPKVYSTFSNELCLMKEILPTPYAISFRRRFFAYYHAVNQPHIKILSYHDLAFL